MPDQSTLSDAGTVKNQSNANNSKFLQSAKKCERILSFKE
jgi:hypothetical protein